MNRFLLYLSILLFGIVQVSNAQSLTVSMPDTNLALGSKSLNIPVKVKNFNNIGAISLKINYNPSAVTFVGKANDATSGITVNNDAAAGVVSLGWFSQDGKEVVSISDGKLIDLVFDYSKGTSTLNFNQQLSEINNITGVAQVVNYINGKITGNIRLSLDNVKATPAEQIVVPLRGFNFLNVGSISLKIGYNSSVLEFVGLQDDAVGFGGNVTASNGVITLGWASNNNVAFNMTDGIVAKLVFKYINNSTPLEIFALNNQTEITDISNNKLDIEFVNGSVAKDRQLIVPFVRSCKDNEVVFPLTAKNMSIGSASIKLSYDPAVMTFKEVRGFTNGGNASANAVNGILTIGYYNPAPVENSGKIFDVVFTYKDGSGSLTFLSNLNEFQITDVNGSIYSGYDVTNGGINADKLPVFNVVAAQSVAENSKLTFNVSAVDADDTTLTYTVSDLPKGATFVGQTFTWTPDFTQSGLYYVNFTVKDPQNGQGTLKVTIAVKNTNRLPVFTAVPLANPRDTLKLDLDNNGLPYKNTYTFTYKATDADGENIKFSIIGGPMGFKINETTGVLTYTLTFNKELVGKLIVGASDGLGMQKDTCLILIKKRTDVQTEDNSIPNVYSLHQNYPNPFNPSTSIKFGLPNESRVKLSVYNLLGQQVALLVDEVKPAGNHIVSFDASKLTSGMYIYRIEANNFIQVKKMTLVK